MGSEFVRFGALERAAVDRGGLRRQLYPGTARIADRSRGRAQI
jgi:hypothetical protein